MATATASVATSFTPLHDRILVRRVEEGESIRGGIIIPDTAKEKPQEGEVVSVGKGKSNDEGKVFRSTSRQATAFCSASIRAPRSRSMVRNSSLCVRKKSSASSRRSKRIAALAGCAFLMHGSRSARSASGTHVEPMDGDAGLNWFQRF